MSELWDYSDEDGAEDGVDPAESEGAPTESEGALLRRRPKVANTAGLT